MLFRTRILSRLVIICGVVQASLATPSMGDVDLVLVTANDCVQTGDVVEIGLFAVSDDANDQSFSTVEAIVRWDPAVLELLQADPAVCSGVPFFICGFLPNPDGLNDGSGSPNLPNNDGDALHTSLSNPNPELRPEAPPPPGLLVTTFRFMASAPAMNSLVFLDPLVPGGISRTRVLEINNIPVTGLIDSSAIITVSSAASDTDGDGVPDPCDVCQGSDDMADMDMDGIPDDCDLCPSVATPGVIQGDTNLDILVDVSDISLFVDALLGFNTDSSVLLASDVNCDGLLNGLDVQMLVEILQ